MLIGKKNKKNSYYKMFKKNLFWRFNGNEKKYLTDILKRGLKPKKKNYNLILEKKWSNYHNLNYSITINSCTSALHIAFLSLGCKKGDEVLVPSLTPVMCANAIIFTGATPIFVDVDEDSFLMCPKDLVKKITPIQTYFPAPGSSESYYHLYVGEIKSFDGERIRGLESENENILVKSYKVKEVRNMLKKGEIKNGLALVALQWFFLEYLKD